MRRPKRPSCFDKAGIRRRVLASSCYPAFFRGHQRVGTPEYLAMMRLRKIWAEGSFSVLKREHCISKIRKRGILAATEECLLAAMALNLKRMVNAVFRYLQIYCSAGTTVGFSKIFAFVKRSVQTHHQYRKKRRGSLYGFADTQRKRFIFCTLPISIKRECSFSVHPRAVLPFFMLLRLAQSYRVWQLLQI